ncbi:Type I restriction-modification system specificity subunit [Bacillus cereus Rock3-42]|nr:Type I restriction-modification system specificity subunit [Bacillus cereus Rock3-42]
MKDYKPKLIIEHDYMDSSYLCCIVNELYPMKKQMAISM